MRSLIDENAKILPSGAVETALCMNKNTLLEYEKKGIVIPDRTKGKPLYSFNDLENLKKAVNS